MPHLTARGGTPGEREYVNFSKLYVKNEVKWIKVTHTCGMLH